MNDQDYIRKAVDLADGWEILLGHWFSSPYDAQRAYHEIEQWELDALAAQLVRQVDATEDYYIDIDLIDKDTGYMVLIGNQDRGKPASVVEGHDRTMNTIMATKPLTDFLCLCSCHRKLYWN